MFTLKNSKAFWVIGSVLILMIVLYLFSFCATPHYNVKLKDPGKPEPVRPVPQDDETLFFLALSGGGSRAATMSWKVLEELKKISYTYRDSTGKIIESNLADQVDYISSISGGSFASVGWGVYRDSMDVFRKRFIERNVQKDLLVRLFWPPKNLFKLISPYFSRINVASEYYDEKIFKKTRFKDLPAHPILWVNATHLALGARFTFSKAFFNLLYSDLDEYPVGYACAASSAFPILLDPITLVNYGTYMTKTDSIKYAFADSNSRSNLEDYFYCERIRFFENEKNRWHHLADGGLVDNQGLQEILDEFETNGIINRKLNDSRNPLRRLVILNVNAGVPGDDKSCRKQSPPHIPSVIKYTMTTSMDRLSGKRWEAVKVRKKEISRRIINAGDSVPAYSKLEVPYCIEVNIRNMGDPAKKEAWSKLPTSFNLSMDQIDLIDEITPELLDSVPDMIRLKESLKAHEDSLVK